MLTSSTSPSSYWLALFIACAAWLAALVCLFFAVRFRVAPIRGDESDIAVGIFAGLCSPAFAGSAIFAFVRRVSKGWRLVLVSPAVIAVIAVCVATIGVTSRP